VKGKFVKRDGEKGGLFGDGRNGSARGRKGGNVGTRQKLLSIPR